MTNQVKEILEWFKLAVPEPTDENRSVQLGVHFEECSEMLNATLDWEAEDAVAEVADDWKIGNGDTDGVRRNDLLDALCDQIVTAIGVAHMFGMDIEGALAEVNRSNWSKFENGKPLFNEQGKIKKGAGYTPPQLDQFIPKEGE